LFNNNNYKIGSDVFNLPDIHLMLPFFKEQFLQFAFLLGTLYFIYAVYKVNNRTKALPKIYIYIYSLSFIFYTLYLRKFFNEALFNKYKVENYIQFFYILSIPFLLYSIYLLIKKLWRCKIKN